MNTSLLARAIAIIPQTPAADYKEKTGYLVDLASGTATISTSATVPAKGIILDGNQTIAGYASEKVSVGILGAIPGTARVRLSGTVAAGANLQQSTDGTAVTDAGTGARVIIGVAIEAGVSGENIEFAPITPRVYAS